MSALEDLAKKYIDEISAILPLPCLFSFVVGIAVMDVTSAAQDSSVWIFFLSKKYSEYWFFGEAIKNTEVWKILLIFSLSFAGPFATKKLAKLFISIGLEKSDDRLKKLYIRAVEVAKKSDFSKIEIDAASQWRIMRLGSVWGYFKSSSFCFSISGVSLFIFLNTFNFIDALVFIISVCLAFFLSFEFSKKYFSAYLPERLLFDASIGLIDPRIAEDM